MSTITDQERQERIEHRDALLNLQAIVKTAPGYAFFKYLFRNYDPLFLPQQGLEGAILYEGLGMRRAFVEIFNLLAEADPSTAGNLLAVIKKEQYEKSIREDAPPRQEG